MAVPETEPKTRGNTLRWAGLAAVVGLALVVGVLIGNGGGEDEPRKAAAGPVPAGKATSQSAQRPVPAGALYVDKDSKKGKCDDARPVAEAKSQSTPWCSAVKAVQLAPAGATVVLQEGKYPEIRATRNPEREKTVTVRGAPGGRVLVTKILAKRANNLRFEGLRVTRGVGLFDTENIAIVNSEIVPAGMYIGHSKDTLVEGNDIRDGGSGDRALIAQGKSSGPSDPGNENLTIRDNHFSNLSYDAIAVYTGVKNLVIEGNEIDNVIPQGKAGLHVDAIQVTGGDGIDIRDNFLHDSTHGLLVKDAVAKKLKVHNNTFARIGAAAVVISNAPGARLTSNTVWDSDSGVLLGDLEQIPEKTSAVLEDNVFDVFRDQGDLIKSARRNIIAGGGELDSRGGLIGGRPKFVNPKKLDYRLAPGSAGEGEGAGGKNIGSSGRMPAGASAPN